MLTGAFGVVTDGKGRSAAAAAHLSIEYRRGYLYWPSGVARAATGAGGVCPNKKEGDQATPAGTFALPFGMYRRDRIRLPNTDLPMVPMLERHLGSTIPMTRSIISWSNYHIPRMPSRSGGPTGFTTCCWWSATT